MSQKCGHPLAARQIVVKGGKGHDRNDLVTRCWACKVEREIRR